jgi:Histidine kinase
MIKPIHIICFFSLMLTLISVLPNWGFYFSESIIMSIVWISVTIFRWGLIMWCNSKIIDFFQSKYPALTQVRRRALFSIPSMIVSTYALILLLEFIKGALVLNDLSGLNESAFILYLINSVILSCIILPTFEMLFSEKVSQRILLENLELRRRNLQGQYDTLKGQVNPHFLFNGLNSLAGLIKKKPQLATYFVDEMAYVYRYLLKSNEDNKVTLKEELKFAQAYFHLLRTRFEDGIQLVIDLSEKDQMGCIAPLTLQILIENAAKHNIVSKSNPIVIHITLEENYIVVKNNVRKKNSSIETTKTGLANIVSKYKLLGATEVEILERTTDFTVKIPVLDE